MRSDNAPRANAHRTQRCAGTSTELADAYRLELSIQDTWGGRSLLAEQVAGFDRRFHVRSIPRFQYGNIVPVVFTPVLAKHSKSFSLIDCISVGVDRMPRNFEPMHKQVEAWQKSALTDVTAEVVIYETFVEGTLEAPKHLARTVHDL